MSVQRALQLLRSALDLCGKVLEQETDPESIARMRGITDELKIAIRLLEQGQHALPLNDNGPTR